MRSIYYSVFLAISIIFAQPSNAATEMEERLAIETATQKSLLAADYSKLEKMSNAYRTEKSRTSSGLWKLTLFYSGIGEAIDAQAQCGESPNALKGLESNIEKWAERFPKSPSAHIANSIILFKQGWLYRGCGYASTVKPESWAPFNRYVAMAEDNLNKYKADAVIDPKWYELMLSIAKSQSWERDKFDKLLKEALDREPLFYQTYFAALEYLLPKWNGSVDEIEKFTQDAVRRTITQEGHGMYARIYWYASQTQFENDLFTSSLAAWPDMKKGFEDVVAQYPDAWNLNNYAKFACLAHDKAKTKELLKRTKSSIVPEAWSPESMRDMCTQWVAE